MAIVRYSLEDGKELTPEQHARMKAEIEEAAKRPYTYDPDCPLLTEEQLAQFRPVNGTWEERAARMEEAYRNGTLERPNPDDFEKDRADYIRKRAEAMRKAGITDHDETEVQKPEAVLAEALS